MRKQYGESKEDNCPFCGKRATRQNSQGVPVCQAHTEQSLDLKCLCGEWLDVKSGKWGPYFNCMKCGNLSYSKGMAMQPKSPEPQSESVQKINSKFSSEIKPSIKERKEITITSDDVEYFD